MLKLDQDKRQLLIFAVIGALGFIIEAVILTIGVLTFEWDAYLARLPSFTIAVTFTWWANRKITFSTRKQKNKGIQGTQYILVQIGGALINWLVYMSILYFYPPVHIVPVLPLAVGAVFGLIFNYILSNRIVFAEIDKSKRDRASE